MVQDNQQITVNVNTLLGHLESDSIDESTITPSLTLSNIRKQLTTFIRSLYRHKRTPATNVYVMMISSEQRQVKPYALPIQLLPYASIDESTMRNLIRDVLKTMAAQGMKVVGMSDKEN